jgi:predicted transcriptional regulator
MASAPQSRAWSSNRGILSMNSTKDQSNVSPVPGTWDEFLGVMKRLETVVGLTHRRRLANGNVPFRQSVRELIQADRSLSWLEQLYPFIDIRNAYAHNPALHPPALIPSLELINEAWALYERLHNPKKVLDRFKQDAKVVVIRPETKLMAVLKFINGKDFSQFPVVVDNKVVGLLTEKTITRWLAAAVTTKESTELSRTTINDIIRLQSIATDNYRVVGQKELADSVARLFVDVISLEAVIIVRDAQSQSGVCGIVTTWDVMNTGSVQ